MAQKCSGFAQRLRGHHTPPHTTFSFSQHAPGRLSRWSWVSVFSRVYLSWRFCPLYLEGWGRGLSDVSHAQVGSGRMVVPECGDRWAWRNKWRAFLFLLTYSFIPAWDNNEVDSELAQKEGFKYYRQDSINLPLSLSLNCSEGRRLGIEMHKIGWVLEATGIKEVEDLWWASRTHVRSLWLAMATAENSRNGMITSSDFKENSHWIFT